MGAVTVTAYDGQFDEGAFSLLPALAGKTFAGHPQAAGAATATDSIRGGKTARKGILIAVRATVTPEDRFAVGEYASAPSEINGRHVPVVSSRTAAHIIVLDRTDGLDPLTGSDYQPMPDSKDAYTLRISKRSAEIRPRSSATLYVV